MLSEPQTSKANPTQTRMASAPVLTSAGKPAPGRVLFVDTKSGEARVRLSLSASSEDPSFFVDQFDVLESPVSRTESRSSRFTRDPAVRRQVLVRAGGICERPSCRKPGFGTLKGMLFLETHHVKPLGENGLDSTTNVVALCPDCHAKAHRWIDRDSLRNELLEWLSRIQTG
jgi:5-methylcytosine-specific restriction enzyme A